MHETGISLVDARGRKYLTSDERNRFLEAVRRHVRPEVQTLALVLAYTGCRISEALATRARDVDLEAAEIQISTLKRRRVHWRSVPVPEELVRELDLVHRVRRLQSSPRSRHRELWPFTRPTASRHIAALMRSAPISGPQACPKGLRHAFGVAAVAAGVPLPTIASILGHADIKTTAIYTTAIGAEARDLIARMWA